MNITVYQLNAFTYNNLGGNPAGVLLNADHLSEKEMQRIAAQVGFSETAFVSKGNECDFTVRFFTPNVEVDFCGHATLATFSLLFQLRLIKAKTYTQQTKAGKLAVNVTSNGYVEMNQALPKFLGKIPKAEIAATLNINENILFVNNLPIEIVSTGLADIIIPITYGYLDDISPNFNTISNVCSKYHTIGYHLFELNKDQSEFTANCRNFAPLVDIKEESATGSASGALASYLTKHQLLSTNTSMCANNYHFVQGKAMNATSSITCTVEKDNTDNISEVKVGGYAQLVKNIKLLI
jgi:PhzF family phenazine biosynthesis protein